MIKALLMTTMLSLSSPNVHTLIKRINPHLSDFSRLRIIGLVKYYAEQEQIDPALVLAVIATESTFNEYSVGSAGELGLMQLHPAYFKATFDIEQNIEQGVKHLAHVRAKSVYKDYRWIEQYNTGLNRQPSSFNYYNKVMKYHGIFRKNY